MKKIIGAARQLRPALWPKGKNFVGDGSTKRHSFWLNTNRYSLYSLAGKSRVCECKHPLHMVSRAISSGMANVDTGGCINVYEFLPFNFI